MDVPPTSRRLRLRDLDFHLLDWGAPGRRPLLLLHGGAQTAHSWEEVAPALAREHHVVALDLRGHGDSVWAPDGDYRLSTLAGDVLALLDALGWREEVALAGMSLGGLVAMTLAAAHPERVRGLVLVDIAPVVESRGVEAVAAQLAAREFASFDEAVERARSFNPRRPVENLRRRLGHALRRLPDGRWAYKFDPAFGSALAGESPEKLWGRLRAVRGPVLLVRGAESPLLSQATVERFHRQVAAGESAVVEGAGHSVMGDNPAGFLAVVVPFLARHGL